MQKFSLFFFCVLTIFSCADNDNDPQPSVQDFVPIKMEDVDGYRELMYDDAAGRVKAVTIVTKFVDGTKSETVQTLVYDASGKLTEITTDTGWRMLYHYDGNGRVTTTEEYENGVWSQRHEYTYHDIGLVYETITYRDVPEEGGVVRVSKEVYSYDSNGNVTSQVLYDYQQFGNEAKLVSTTTFSKYDSKINTESYFAINPFNPLAKVKNNNPGKMVIKNGSGSVTMVETYRYKYNEAGYATHKTSMVTLYNGNSGSFTTRYTFK